MKESKRSEADLYSDHGRDSDEARELLQKDGVSFDEWMAPEDYVPEPGFNPPVLHAQEGEFLGIKGVQSYLDIIADDPRRS